MVFSQSSYRVSRTLLLKSDLEAIITGACGYIQSCSKVEFEVNKSGEVSATVTQEMMEAFAPDKDSDERDLANISSVLAQLDTDAGPNYALARRAARIIRLLQVKLDEKEG